MFIFPFISRTFVLISLALSNKRLHNTNMATLITNDNYTTQEKLQILADAAKYDVACTSSGSSRRGKKGELANAEACGICHSFAPAGQSTQMIIDDNRKTACVHVKDGENYLRYLTDEEFKTLRLTESYEDEYTAMWKTFFHAISIKQRENYICQRNLFPIWKQKHAVEFK